MKHTMNLRIAEIDAESGWTTAQMTVTVQFVRAAVGTEAPTSTEPDLRPGAAREFVASPVEPDPASGIRVRPAAPGDLDALVNLEKRVFATDRMSRRSFRSFLKSPTAEVIVAQEEDTLGGMAIVQVPTGSGTARLHSIAVAPHMGGRGVGAMLLAAAEAAALKRHCRAIQLEVHETNAAAISRYRKSGYREFRRVSGYYEDGGDALRFEKRLAGNEDDVRQALDESKKKTAIRSGKTPKSSKPKSLKKKKK
jgi:ribosomal protein S18 acetylase RimI-like enzyme